MDWMVGGLMIVDAGGAPRAVSLVGGAAGAEPAAAWSVLWLALIAAGAALIVGALMVRAWVRLEGAEQAFRVLSLRMGLSRRERRVVRQLAAAQHEVKPVALLLCAEALQRAATRADRTSGLTIDARALARLRQRLAG